MKNREFMKYILSNLLFGFNGVVASYILLHSTQIVLLRTALGSLSLLVLFLVGGGRFTFLRKKASFLFLVLSGVAMGTSWMFLYEAYDRIGVSIGTLLYYCGPVIVMVTSPLLFRERLTVGKVAGFALVLVGVLLVNGRAVSSGMDLWGIGCGLLSAVTYAVMVICNKKASDIGGLENPTLQLLVSFATVALILTLRQGLGMSITAESILPIAVLGLLGTGLGCYWYFSSLGALRAQTVAAFGYLELLSAVVFSAMFLGERMDLLQWLGGGLIVGGAVLGEWKKKK